jgi:hypothetical protein
VNRHVNRIARHSGFVFWDSEPWGPGIEAVDWSSDYDQELTDFWKNTVWECVAVIENPGDKQKLLKHWGIVT